MISENNCLLEVSKNIKHKKNKINNNQIKNVMNNICIAAKHIVTKTDAIEDLKQGPVYLITEEINSEMVQTTYRQCKRPATHNCFCRAHNDATKTFKIFEKDILPIKDTSLSSSGIRSTLITGNEKYFDIIKNKNKKKNISITLKFDTEDEPLLLCLNNSELLTELKLHAVNLLKRNTSTKEQNILIDNSKKNIHTNNLSPSINLVNSIKELTKSFENSSLLDINNDDNGDNINHESDDNIDSLSINNNITENIISDNESIISNEDEDETECIEIFSTDSKRLFLNNTNIVFESDDGCDAIEIGILTKIDEKYHTIKHENQYFTVMKNIKCPETQTDLKLCVLTDKVFDLNHKHIGKIIKNNNNNIFKITFKSLVNKI